MFSNRPKTLLYLQNGKAQISISSVSQTKELITGTENRDQVFLATPLGLFSNFPRAAADHFLRKNLRNLRSGTMVATVACRYFPSAKRKVQCLRESFAFA